MLKIHHRSPLQAGQVALCLILSFVASCNLVACQSSNAAPISVKNITTNSSSTISNYPPVILNPVGKMFIQHGELLNLTINFNGTAPFKYRYKFCRDTDFLPCDFCLYPLIETYAYEAPITQYYLHHVGNYTLMFEVRNKVGRNIKYYTIKVNETFREQTLPFAPIVSSILAVLILITGVTVHLRLRKTAYTETANFDFIRQGQEEEDWEEEQSFIQRVRYIFCRGNDDNSYDEALFNERQPFINKDNRRNSSFYDATAGKTNAADSNDKTLDQ